MKITVVPSWTETRYTVELKQGVQSFRLEYHGTKDDCLWYARMFRKALKAHDAEIVQLAERLPCKQEVVGSTPGSIINCIQLPEYKPEDFYVPDKTNLCEGVSVGCHVSRKECDKKWQESQKEKNCWPFGIWRN